MLFADASIINVGAPHVPFRTENTRVPGLLPGRTPDTFSPAAASRAKAWSVSDAPRHAPDMVASNGFIARDFDDGVAATEEHQPPPRDFAIEPKIEPQACAVECGCALQIIAPNDQMIEPDDMFGVYAGQWRVTLQQEDTRAIRAFRADAKTAPRLALLNRFRRQADSLATPVRAIDVRNREGDAFQPLAAVFDGRAQSARHFTLSRRRHDFDGDIVGDDQRARDTVSFSDRWGVGAEDDAIGGDARMDVIHRDNDVIYAVDHVQSQPSWRPKKTTRSGPPLTTAIRKRSP